METLNETLRNKKKQRWCLLFLLGVTVFFFLSISYVSAAETAKEDGYAVLKYMQEQEIDSKTGIISNLCRQIGYTIVKAVGALVDGLYDSLERIYNLLSFGTSGELTRLVKRYSVLYKSLFIVSLVCLGVYMLTSKRANQLNTINLILVMAVVIMAMPLLTSKLTTLTVKSSDLAMHEWYETNSREITSIASTVIADNLVDLKKVDGKTTGGKKVPAGLKAALDKDKGYNSLTSGTKKWRYININAAMDDNLELRNDFWEKEIGEDKDGKEELKDINSISFFGIGDSFYYRYQVISWLSIFGLLLTAVVVLFFACVRCARIIIEVAMAAVYMPFVAVTDIATGQRIKEAIKHFISLFFALFMCIALLGVYFVGYAYINKNVDDTFTKLLMHIALAWAIIDGPNILERILGVDVGIKSGWQMLMGARAAGSMAGAAGKTAAAGAGVMKTAGRTAGRAAGTAGKVLFGNRGMQKAQNAAKEMGGHIAGKAKTGVKNATGGNGLAGFVGNAASGAKDKMTPANGTEALNHAANKENMKLPASGARLQTEQTAAGGQSDPGGLRKSTIPPYDPKTMDLKKSPAQSLERNNAERKMASMNLKKGPTQSSSGRKTVVRPYHPNSMNVDHIKNQAIYEQLQRDAEKNN